MEKIKIPKKLKQLAEVFRPFPLYAVGGFVRNSLMGIAPSDIDICSPLDAETARAKIGEGPFYVTAQYNNLGTLKISAGEGESYEYTAFRREEYEQGGAHRPCRVEFCQDMESDAVRRDFTVNAIYYDIQNDKVCDPTGGVNDIKDKVIRGADLPQKVFSSDGLRLLRAVRFACELGFDIEKNTYESVFFNYMLLRDIKSERVYEELRKILLSDTKYPSLTAGTFPHYRGVELLKELNLLPIIFPGIELCYGVSQRADFHKYDVFEHTAQVVKFSPPEIRLAALLHDIAKGSCYKEQGNFHGHETAGAEKAKALLGQEGLKCPNALADKTAALIKCHMYDLNCKTSENKVRLFIVKNYGIMPELLQLKQADYLGCGLKTGISPTVERWEKLIAKMKIEGVPFTLKELAVNGADISGTGCPKPYISKILQRLHKDCILNPRLNDKHKLLHLAQTYSANLDKGEKI